MAFTRDELFHIVCCIRTPTQDGRIRVGTGLFMSTDGADAYLITASHVAKETNQSTVIAYQWHGGKCASTPISSLSPTLEWVHHEIADMSLLKLSDNHITQIVASKRCLPLSHFNLEEKPASRDDELTAIGFPHGLGTEGFFSPLTFRSFASSSYLTLPRADTNTPCTFFCLENPSVGGYSGCPVMDLGYMVTGMMVQTKGEAVCHGIMHGTMADETGGKIALVTPMFYLKDLLKDFT